MIVVTVVVIEEVVVMREEMTDEMTEEIMSVEVMIDVREDPTSLEMKSRNFKKFIFLKKPLEGVERKSL